ncbi:MAG: hypothetical protein MI861_22695, partial [Pirellulales bacterium]|nr:hypothetical protein [Pirellulales bacterium]
MAEVGSGRLVSIAAWPDEKKNGPPVAEMQLVARDVVIDETKFVVAKSLTDDGRIGKVVDAQGIVTLRPMMGKRWTPISPQMLLKPGDWLRSDLRGANASQVSLSSQYQVTAGPGSLLELQSPHQLRLHSGEVKVVGRKSAENNLQILGPNGQTLSVGAGQTGLYRLTRHEKLEQVSSAPRWLAGFEGSSSEESIGSLICRVDGRDVPLTVGFHHVKVEIRDQIARTTIEESFVNHTRRDLEGTFHFPLPQDASISGFGMGIGDKLVEADVVEKQRAREIYETILRERRDPGLLEWSGGNIFKARVFPIPAFSEKKIRIVYTQVLPLRANQFRYSYGLRSELLRKTPLRDLSLDVRVHSALPLKSVRCGTHPSRTQQTEHSARVEFTAQQYTPTRDFEVVCEVDAVQSDVVAIPHQRGDDGYFMVQLVPPVAAGNWQRQVLPDGQPLRLLLVCDTSASMDSQKRELQHQFVASVLAALGPQDRFNLAVADVDCHWLHESAVASTAETADQAMQWLEDRVSLGWTDLDRLAESVLQRTDQPTHVIYVGDGIVTARDADPQSFANRLQQLAGQQRQGTFHAVSVGNSFESTTLHAMAAIGGGSVRQVQGDRTAAKVAFELLNEIAQPGLRDVKVEFRGLQVAAVYPKKLPNLAAGTQQILIGRYLPTGKDQSGEVIVTANHNGKEVRFVSRINLTDAEQGNSFLPRLWARAHLDQLLLQGNSAPTRDQIIALSEEFHIITPYTSLLVLETDEDRQRFGVKRRFQMRDGEAFFAAGAARAKYELLQAQMKLAGDWRLELRRRFLAELQSLGRNSVHFANLQKHRGMSPASGVSTMTSLSAGGIGGYWTQDHIGSYQWFAMDQRSGGQQMISPLMKSQIGWDVNDGLGLAVNEFADSDGQLIAGFPMSSRVSRRLVDRERLVVENALQPLAPYRFAGTNVISSQPMFAGERFQNAIGNGHWQSIRWLDTLFPTIPSSFTQHDHREPHWPAEALKLSNDLLQPLVIEDGGIQLTRDLTGRDARWDRISNQRTTVELYSPKQWLTTSSGLSEDTFVEWCDAEHRGIFSQGFQLGRQRLSRPSDL